MTEPLVRIEPTRVSVEPGGQVTVQVTVFNPGTVVEGYDVDVVSEIPMPWVIASPATLSVYPQQEATALVSFAPPSGHDTPSGSFAFGVRLRSQVDAGRSAVAEGDLDIGAVSGLQASLTPVTSSGRWRGSHTLKIENWGNSLARLSVVAEDPDQELGFLVSPPLLEVPLGGQGYARIKVRTRHPVLRGATTRRPFKVVCQPEGPPGPAGHLAAASTTERPVLDGGFNQKPILTRWLMVAAGFLLLALIALLVWLWQRPDSEPEPQDLAIPPDQPVNLASAAVPGVITLSWDAVSGAESYAIELTAPANETKPANAQSSVEDPNRVQFAMETDRAEVHCYVVFALNKAGSTSIGSEPICETALLTSEQAESLLTKGAPEEPATIVPAPGFEPTSGQPTPAPPTATPTTPPTATAQPAFIAPVKWYTADNITNATTDHQLLLENSLPATLAANEGLGLPEVLPVVLYVGGVTEDEAIAACESAKALLSQLGPCLGAPFPGASPAAGSSS